MTTEPNIQRWLDDEGAPPEVRDLLTFARSDGASAAQLDKLARRLAPAVGVGASALIAAPLAGTAPVAPSAPSLAGSALGKGLVAKVLGSTALKLTSAAAVVSATVWYFNAPPAPAPRVTKTPAPISAPLPKPAPVAPVVTKLAVEPSVPAVEAPKAAKPAHRAAARVVEPAPVQTPQPSELELIREAQALRGKPTQELATLARHERLYPAGMLAQEREVLVIEALLAQGRHADAEARARKLEAAYPGSAHLRRVRVLLGEKRPE